MDIPVGSQLRAARGLLNMSVSQLAEQTGLAINTIRRAEATNGPAPITAANMKAIVGVFVTAGVMFIPADDHGPGVRLSAVTPRPTQRRRRGASSTRKNDAA